MARAGLRGARRHWMAIAIPIAVLVILAVTIAFLIDEPLRRYTEAKMNHALKGYTARIGKLDFHPLGFSLDLRDVVITQDAHPEPPVFRLERLSASVHWRALLSRRLVGDVELDKPAVYVNLPQARKEIADPTPVRDRGWQDALQAVYPLKIDHFEIRGGDVTYIDQGPSKPLRIRELDLVATNIRNRPRKRRYPSDVRFSAVVFESGRLTAEGQANFLAEPNPTFRGDVELANVELDYFKPITNRYNLSVDKGTLSATGHAEYGLEAKTVVLSRATHRRDPRRLRAHRPDGRRRAGDAWRRRPTRPSGRTTPPTCSSGSASSGSRGARSDSSTRPPRRLTASFSATPTEPWRICSNQRAEGAAVAKLKGAFMGTGTATAEATFTSEKSGPASILASESRRST